MYRRDLFDRVGGYRKFFSFAQDYDLWCRMSGHSRFHVIPEVLYRRKIGVPGSVTASAEKLILQKYCSSFAAYCHAERLQGRPDPLDQSGPISGLGLPISGRVKKKLFIVCFKLIAQSDPNGAARACHEVMKHGGAAGLLARMVSVVLDAFPVAVVRATRAFARFARVRQLQ